MTRLSELPYDEGDTCLENLIIWGISPMQQLVDIMDETIEDEMDGPEDATATKMMFIMYELKHKLEDMEEALFRYQKAFCALEAEKELAREAKERQLAGVKIDLEEIIPQGSRAPQARDQAANGLG